MGEWFLDGPIWHFFVSIFAGIVLSVVILLVSIVFGSRAYGATECSNWGKQTGYNTKFEVLNFMDTGTCLALAPNGRWVLNTQVLSFANKG